MLLKKCKIAVTIFTLQFESSVSTMFDSVPDMTGLVRWLGSLKNWRKYGLERSRAHIAKAGFEVPESMKWCECQVIFAKWIKVHQDVFDAARAAAMPIAAPKGKAKAKAKAKAVGKTKAKPKAMPKKTMFKAMDKDTPMPMAVDNGTPVPMDPGMSMKFSARPDRDAVLLSRGIFEGDRVEHVRTKESGIVTGISGGGADTLVEWQPDGDIALPECHVVSDVKLVSRRMGLFHMGDKVQIGSTGMVGRVIRTSLIESKGPDIISIRDGEGCVAHVPASQARFVAPSSPSIVAVATPEGDNTTTAGISQGSVLPSALPSALPVSDVRARRGSRCTLLFSRRGQAQYQDHIAWPCRNGDCADAGEPLGLVV